LDKNQLVKVGLVGAGYVSTYHARALRSLPFVEIVGVADFDQRRAEALAHQFGFRHEYIATREFENPDYVRNAPDRCFHCKDELFARLGEVVRERGFAILAALLQTGEVKAGPSAAPRSIKDAAGAFAAMQQQVEKGLKSVDEKTWEQKIGHIYGPDGSVFLSGPVGTLALPTFHRAWSGPRHQPAHRPGQRGGVGASGTRALPKNAAMKFAAEVNRHIPQCLVQNNEGVT